MSTTACGETPDRVASVSYYDPVTGQYTTPDPLYALTGSRYGYAGNDPINGTDPSGLICGQAFGGGSFNPACMTLNGYLGNCTGSECPANCPPSKCPDVGQALADPRNTSYYPQIFSYLVPDEGQDSPCPPTLEGQLSAQNNPNSPEYQQSGPGASGGAYAGGEGLAVIAGCVERGIFGAVTGRVFDEGHWITGAIRGCIGDPGSMFEPAN